MYNNHESCIHSIQFHERKLKMKFDYILMTREDIYYFHPMNLSELFPYFQDNSHNHTEVPRKDGSIGKCDLLSKACIACVGINMKMQFAPRDQGMEIFGTKLAFYQSLFDHNKTLPNPEFFEAYFVKNHLSLQSCRVPIELFPVAAARQNNTGNICFLQKEIQMMRTYSCVPADSYEMVQSHRCLNDKWTILPSPPPFHLFQEEFH